MRYQKLMMRLLMKVANSAITQTDLSMKDLDEDRAKIHLQTRLEVTREETNLEIISNC